ncbi:SRPBCC family protein [Halorubrum distributum]|uniref:SRPBCC family protein n=1 Tax=Halorubrum distributum TaxID=29283 RepID=A0A6B1IL47_9EURY|nr:SRPBCC family protein [Halorubrum terrestre]MYL67157.1 SRPBCC family protein [Halorubrum terrestre]
MNEVTLSRAIEAPPEAVRDAMVDAEAFVRSSGFDEVEVDGETVRVANDVGVASIELTLELVDDPDADLASEQREGIFESMRTEYVVAPAAGGSEVTATTEFALDVALIGDLLDGTVIERQRRRELSAQFDWLEARCVDGSTATGE